MNKKQALRTLAKSIGFKVSISERNQTVTYEDSHGPTILQGLPLDNLLDMAIHALRQIRNAMNAGEL